MQPLYRRLQSLSGDIMFHVCTAAHTCASPNASNVSRIHITHCGHCRCYYIIRKMLVVQLHIITRRQVLSSGLISVSSISFVILFPVRGAVFHQNSHRDDHRAYHSNVAFATIECEGLYSGYQKWVSEYNGLI